MKKETSNILFITLNVFYILSSFTNNYLMNVLVFSINYPSTYLSHISIIFCTSFSISSRCLIYTCLLWSISMKWKHFIHNSMLLIQKDMSRFSYRILTNCYSHILLDWYKTCIYTSRKIYAITRIITIIKTKSDKWHPIISRFKFDIAYCTSPIHAHGMISYCKLRNNWFVSDDFKCIAAA